jgi:Holliday junction resolvasome RuvABC endonuclease subunit
MQRAVMHQFGLRTLPEPPDVADAIAIAACSARRHRDAADAGPAGIMPVRRGRRLR